MTESQFLEAQLVQQADGELKNILVVSYDLILFTIQEFRK